MRPRPEGTINEQLSTGKIEVLGLELEVLNAPKPRRSSSMTTSARRYPSALPLYRSAPREMQRRMRMRNKISRFLREYLHEQGFCEIETPMLTKATPEGARDYMVPSRTYPGSFFALPQSPQLFKQLLMMSGMDRYYQIVRCFRDEDLRADRQPEFTQLDIETSFLDENAVMQIIEDMMRRLFREILGIDMPSPLPRMTYAEAMERYGSDKPDLRIPLELVELGEGMKGVEFKVFSGPANDPKGASSCCACRRRENVAQGNRRLRRICRSLRCQGSGLDQDQRYRGKREGLTIADREVSAG